MSLERRKCFIVGRGGRAVLHPFLGVTLAQAIQAPATRYPTGSDIVHEWRTLGIDYHHHQAGPHPGCQLFQLAASCAAS